MRRSIRAHDIHESGDSGGAGRRDLPGREPDPAATELHECPAAGIDANCAVVEVDAVGGVDRMVTKGLALPEDVSESPSGRDPSRLRGQCWRSPVRELKAKKSDRSP